MKKVLMFSTLMGVFLLLANNSGKATGEMHRNTRKDGRFLLAEATLKQGSVRATCPWDGRKEVKFDAFNCGRLDTGQPIRAIYECGKTDNCEDKCIFIECTTGP